MTNLKNKKIGMTHDGVLNDLVGESVHCVCLETSHLFVSLHIL